MNRALVLPKSIWDSIINLKDFCKTKECYVCPLGISESEHSYCLLAESVDEWLDKYSPSTQEMIALEYKEEE